MTYGMTIALTALLVAATSVPAAGEDRTLVNLPEPMQAHMLANMRDHLTTLDLILGDLAGGKVERAAEAAEQRLGMSSLAAHGAEHMGPFMPEGMRAAGTAMHRAASRFAVVAVEGDGVKTYAALREVTAACVACHSGYRLR